MFNTQQIKEVLVTQKLPSLFMTIIKPKLENRIKYTKQPLIVVQIRGCFIFWKNKGI